MIILFCSFYLSTSFERSILKHFLVCCFDDFFDIVELLRKCYFDFFSCLYWISAICLSTRSARLLTICCLALVMLIFLHFLWYLPRMMHGIVEALRLVKFERLDFGLAGSMLGIKHGWLWRDIELNGLTDFGDNIADPGDDGFVGLLSCRGFGFGVFETSTIFHVNKNISIFVD